MLDLISKEEEFQGIELLKENSLINRLLGKLNFLARNSSRKIFYGMLSLCRYYENLFYIKNKKNIEQLKGFDIYFSPFTPASAEIMESEHIKRFMMIHDIIPISENDGKIPDNPRIWSYRLYNTINKNDFYVTNSENTRKDVLRTYPFVKEENIKTTYLGVSEIFSYSNANVNYSEETDTMSLRGTNIHLSDEAIQKNNHKIQKSDGIATPLSRLAMTPSHNTSYGTAREKYVFSLCTLGKRKNLIFGIKNFFAFIEKHKIKDLKLVLAGSVWKKFEKELDSTLKNIDKSKIELLGYVMEQDLPELYSNAMMFIYPSLYEGFGLPVLEAMACGCPVITSNISSLPEVIGEAGIKINPSNDEEMIQAFEKMYFDNFYRELCSERGKIRAQKFTWQKCVSELLEFIKTK